MSAAFVVTAVLWGPASAHAQAWTRDAGSAYASLSLATTSGDRLFGSDFSIQDLPTKYSQLQVSAYAEAGIIDRWLTATVNAELFRRNALSGGASVQGIGDARVGLWTGLLTAPFRLTFGVNLGLPLGDADLQVSADGDVDGAAAASLPTGDGEFDVEPSLLFGYAFGGQSWPLRHFVVAGAGYWLRDGAVIGGVRRSFSDAFTYRLEVGSQLPGEILGRFWLIVRVSGVESFASDAETAASPTGLGNGVTYTSYGVELSGRIYGGLGASVGFASAFRARGIVAAAPLRFGLSYEL